MAGGALVGNGAGMGVSVYGIGREVRTGRISPVGATGEARGSVAGGGCEAELWQAASAPASKKIKNFNGLVLTAPSC